MSARIFFRGIIIVLLLSSCGSITKMRYSRGFKSNLEWHQGQKFAKGEPQKAIKALKRQTIGSTFKNDSQSSCFIPSFKKDQYPEISVNDAGKTSNTVIGTTKKPVIGDLNRYSKGNASPLQRSDEQEKVEDKIFETLSIIACFVILGGIIVVSLGTLLAYDAFVHFGAEIGIPLMIAGIVMLIGGIVLHNKGRKKIRNNYRIYADFLLSDIMAFFDWLFLIFTTLSLAVWLSI